MKLVKEHINEKFQLDSDPISDMGIGIRQFWKQKYDEIYPDNWDCTRIHLYKFKRKKYHTEPLDRYPYYVLLVRITLHTVLKLLEDKTLTEQKSFNKTYDEEMRDEQTMPLENKKLIRKLCAEFLKENFHIRVK